MSFNFEAISDDFRTQKSHQKWLEGAKKYHGKGIGNVIQHFEVNFGLTQTFPPSLIAWVRSLGGG